MTDTVDELLPQLLDLIDSLRGETTGFIERPDETQTWYNRGYANGMVVALGRLGFADRLGPRVPDAPEALQPHRTMAWGRAYRHGEEMGERETHEIVEQAGQAE